jgi:hypothetical protein
MIRPLVDQTVCVSGSISIPSSVSLVESYAGNITYQWSLSATPVTVPVSANGNYSTGITQTFTNITGATAANYLVDSARMGAPTTAGNPKKGSSTFYRLTAGQTGNACRNTDDVAIYVAPNSQYTLPSNTICAGTVTTTVVGTLVSGTSGAAKTYWQRSSDGGSSWTTITANLDAAAYSVTYSTFTTPTLTLSASPASINGFKYRIVTTNSFGETFTSTSSVISSVIGSSTNKPQGIWSVRKLNSSYTGNAMLIRRSSDNTTLNIGFTASGDLDTAAIKTFVGNNNAFVVTWYDQSGFNNHVTQSSHSAGANVAIVLSGSLVTQGTKPALYMKDQNMAGTVFTASEMSTYMVGNLTNLTGYNGYFYNRTTAGYSFTIINDANGSPWRSTLVRYSASVDSSWPESLHGSSYRFSSISTGRLIETWNFSGSRAASEYALNGANTTITGPNAGWSGTSGRYRVGPSGYNGGNASGVLYFQEFIVYDRKQTSAIAIQDNLDQYFEVY